MQIKFCPPVASLSIAEIKLSMLLNEDISTRSVITKELLKAVIKGAVRL